MPFVIMVAGPNGSGKTTLTKEMSARGVLFGRYIYINADDIAQTQEGQRSLALLPRALQTAQRAFLFENSNDEGLRLALSKTTLTPGRPTYRLADSAPPWVVAAFRATRPSQ